MAIHLNYDGNQENGIIFNNTYTWGAMYKGANLKPTLSFNYDSMQYSEVFIQRPNYVILNGVSRAMTTEEGNEVKALALTWVQEPLQEGGVTWLANKAILDANRDAMVTVCITALQTNGYTNEQIDLLFPNRSIII